MSLTELQGGSDVRTNVTTATPEGDGYVINGSKWFTSAPMSDGFFTLAKLDEESTLFFIPRILDDGGEAAGTFLRTGFLL